jgi:Zn-dependent M28 family amino/carboxypeptidase
VAVTAEEAGLLGSDYFVHYPPVPQKRLVADVNLDGLMMLYEPLDVIAYGAEHSSLLSLAQGAAASLGFRLSPDPWPDQALFVRSDHYSFVRQGIPAVFLMAGMASGSGSSGERVFRGWLGSLYHTPKDDTEQKMDFEAGARLARVSFLIGWSAASQPERPRFNPGDPFGPGSEGLRPAPPP